jgi:hypothetical protein
VTLVPIQCCCEPGRRLGWLDLPPDKVRNGARLRYVIYAAPPTPWAPVFPGRLPPPIQAEVLEAEVRWHWRVAYKAALLPCGHYTIPLVVKRLAVSSHEHPLEKWQRVRDFTPATIVDNK